MRSSFGSVAKSLATSSREEMLAIVTDRSTTGTMIYTSRVSGYAITL